MSQLSRAHQPERESARQPYELTLPGVLPFELTLSGVPHYDLFLSAVLHDELTVGSAV